MRLIIIMNSAGGNLVLHKDSKWKESWDKFKETNSLMQSVFRVQKSYEESENPVIEATKTVTGKVRNVFVAFSLTRQSLPRHCAKSETRALTPALTSNTSYATAASILCQRSWMLTFLETRKYSSFGVQRLLTMFWTLLSPPKPNKVWSATARSLISAMSM